MATLRVACVAALVLLRVVPAWAQAPVPLALAVPTTHPRIGLVAKDVARLRAKLANEPWAGLWSAVVSRSETAQRGALDPANAFGGATGQAARFSMTEQLECVALHALVGEDADAAKALSAFFEAWDSAPAEKDIAADDFMSSGEFFEGLAVVLDWTWDLLTPKARARLRGIVERRAAHNHDGFVQKKSWEATCEANNHSMAAMGALGLAAVALWHEHPATPTWAGLAHAKAKAYLATSFDSDGACYEGTMYGPFGLFRILPFADACTRYGVPDLLGKGFLTRVVAQLVNELVPGRQRMLPINDTDGNYAPWGGVLFLYAATRYADPVARWMWTTVLARAAGNGGHTWPFALVYEDGASGGAAPTTLVACARGRGTLTVRTGWEAGDFLAAFECGKRVSGTHGQSDVGHFLLYARGRCLAADTGYSNVAAEGSPHQSVGHNLVLVDGKGEVITGCGQVTEGRLVQWEDKKRVVWAQADLAGAYAQKGYNPLALAQRCFLVLTGTDPYAVVADAFVKDTTDHEYTWLLHGTGDSTFDTKAPGRAVHCAGDLALDVVPCLVDPPIPTFEARPFPCPDLGEHLLLRGVVRARRWLGLTVLSPRALADSPAVVQREVKGGKLVVTVRRGDATDVFTLALAPTGGIGSIRVARGAGAKPADAIELRLK